jgi:hypothetical protein
LDRSNKHNRGSPSGLAYNLGPIRASGVLQICSQGDVLVNWGLAGSGILLAIALAGLTYVLGGLVPAVLMAGAVLVASVVRSLTALGSGPKALRLFVLCAGAGGLVAAGSAIQALMTVGGEAGYQTRLGFGWAAFLLGMAAAVVPLALTRQPRLGATVMMLAGLAGSVAINLFFINAFYVFALPVWIAGALAAFIVRPSPDGAGSPAESGQTAEAGG